MNHHVLHREGKQTRLFLTQNLQSIVLVLLLEANEQRISIIRILPGWKYYNYETFETAAKINILDTNFTVSL